MQTNFKKLLIAGITIIVVVIALVVTRYDQNGDVSGLATPLSKIYGSSKIEDKGDYYLVDSKKVYSKTIQGEDSKLLLIAESGEDGGIYRFYTLEEPPKLLKEVEIFGQFRDSEEVFKRGFFEKDITGDSINELFIKVLISGNNLAWYEIFRWEEGALVNLKRAGEKSNLVDFDDINYENDHITMTWHAVDASGKTSYDLKDNLLVPVKNIGFFHINNTEDQCEVRENKVYDEFIVLEKEKCSILGTNFDPYFDN